MKWLIPILLMIPSLAFAGGTWFNTGGGSGAGAALGLAGEIYATSSTVETTPAGAWVLAASTNSYTIDAVSDTAFLQTGDDPEICYSSGSGDTQRFIFQANGSALRTTGSGNAAVGVAFGGKVGSGVTGSDLIADSEQYFTVSNSSDAVAFATQSMGEVTDGYCIGLLVNATAGVGVTIDSASILLHADTGGTSSGGGGGGTDSQIVHSVGISDQEIYTFNDLPDSTIYAQSLERTVPASNGNIRIGDVDFPWGYTFSCGPSGTSLMDDCTQGYYWNKDSIGAVGRVNPFLPSFGSQIIENSFVASGTGGDFWYEQNEHIYYPLIDVTIAPSGGAWGVDNYLIIGDIWGGGTESWAKILTVNGSALRLSFQGTLVSPANLDTVTEVDNMTDRVPTGVSGTWPATETPVNLAVRTNQQEFSMAGNLSTWKFLVPTDMTAADLDPKTIMTVGMNSSITGAQINYSGTVGNTGLTVGGNILIQGESNAAAPCDTYGCLQIRNAAGGTARIMASNEIGSGTSTDIWMPTTSGGNPTLAPIPHGHPRAGIGYAYQIGWIGGTHTGDAYCHSAVRGAECSTVICHGEHTSAAGGDDGHNSDCTASSAPWACCTGSGTGSCAAVMIEDCTTTLNPASGAHNSHWATIVCNESDVLP